MGERIEFGIYQSCRNRGMWDVCLGCGGVGGVGGVGWWFGHDLGVSGGVICVCVL